MSETAAVGFVGVGQMGEALIKGLVEANFCEPGAILASDVRGERLDAMGKRYQILTTAHNSDLVERTNVVVLAVKPQDVRKVLSELTQRITRQHLIISIAAGVSLSTIENQLDHGVRVIRVMPNTPCLIRKGCSAITAGHFATQADVDLARSVFSAVGEVVNVDEGLMDAVTGLSGNGPAYVFLFTEALIEAGVRMGIPRPTARTLTLHTIRGAAELLMVTGEHPAVLKEQVTSPGGTALAALAQLEKGAFRGLLLQAVEVGTERARYLGELLKAG
jgi:pyrroline-5-carboxylate reductase